MRMKRWALAALACLGVAACGRGGDDAATVGFAQIGSESGWRAAETRVARTEAEKRGVNLKISDAQQRQENQIRAIRSFIAQDVDGILLAPVVETGWDTVLAEAREAEIPVVLVDRNISTSNPDLYLSAVTSDSVHEGRVAGQWLVKTLAGRPCRVVELQGTVGASVTNNRKRGFAEAVAGAPNITIVRSQSGDFTRAKGKEVMEAFLKAEGKKINVLYAHNDDMAIGAIQAIEEAGLKPAKDIVIISIDAVKGAFEAMMQGKLNVSVECSPLLGPQLMQAVKDVVAGKPVPKRIVTEEGIFPMEVAAKEFPKRKY